MNLKEDWALVRGAAPELERYLLSPVEEWPLPAAGFAGGLTPGNLLLSLARLSAAPLNALQAEELAGLKRRVNELRDHWRANWIKKCQREWEVRLRQWQRYAGTVREEGPFAGSGYARRVRVRAILSLLQEETGSLAGEQRARLQSADALLRGGVKPGPFVWEPELEHAFSEEQFWYLYIGW